MRNWMSGLLATLCFVGCFGCTYPLERDDGVRPGEIHFTPLRPDGTAAVGAVAFLNDGSRAASVRSVANAAGDLEAVLTDLDAGSWLVRIVEDTEGDGIADLGAWMAPVGLVDRSDNTETSSVIVGNVELTGTGSIGGTIDVDGRAVLDTEAARVVVWRELDGRATTIEGASGVTASGAFRIDGVIAGTVRVAIFAWTFGEEPAAPTFFGTSDVVVASGQTTTTALSASQTARDGPGALLTSLSLEANWNTRKTSSLEISLITAGAPNNGVDLAPEDTSGRSLAENERVFFVDLPIGVVDVQLTSATDGVSDGLLRGAVVVPGPPLPDVSAILGPVALSELADPCVATILNDTTSEPDDTTTVRDCDRDGLVGLPLPDVDTSSFSACAAACASAFGTGRASAVCTVGGTFDCDDDGDGQPDVTEPVRCIGPGIGTDLDADDACEPAEDPFPFCTSNDPTSCPQAFAQPASRY